MNFAKYDDKLTHDEYYQFIRNILFPNSTENSWNVFTFKAIEHIQFKGAINIRARKISHHDLLKFKNEEISISEFFAPPACYASPGRYNERNSRVLYLSSSYDISISECEITNGDYFLLAKIGFSKQLRFFSLDEKNKATLPIFQLLNSPDKRFYPVICRVLSDLLEFPGFDGFYYQSVSLQRNNINNTKQQYNLAVKEDSFQHTYLQEACLCQLIGPSLENIQTLQSYTVDENKKIVTLSQLGCQEFQTLVRNNIVPVEEIYTLQNPTIALKIIN